MKALSFTQPWATLVAIGAKRIETRSWSTSYRGSLAVHAALGFPRDAIQLCFEQPFARVLFAAGIQTPADLPRGAVIAIATLTACRPTWQDGRISGWATTISDQEDAFGDFSAGRFGWYLGGVLMLPKPVPARGSLGLWEWSPSPEVVAHA